MIEEQLYNHIRAAALRRRETVSSIVAEALKEYVAKRETSLQPIPLPLGPSGKMRRLPDYIDPRSASQVSGYLDDLDLDEGKGFSQI